MTLRRFLATLTVAVVLLLLIAVWLYPSDEDFRAENPFWNGASGLFPASGFVPLESLKDLPASPHGAGLLLIPRVPPSAPDIAALGAFVAAGGTLVLADDYGYGNQVLEGLGLNARFSGDALLDPLFSYRNPWLPRVHHVAARSVTAGVEAIVLNHATALTGVAGGEILASTSSFSFLDADDNGMRDDGEEAGPLPVVSLHGVGAGKVILIADPSIFINSMSGMEGNGAFVRSISRLSGSGVFVDQSHLGRSHLDEARQTLAVARSIVSKPAVMLALLATLLGVILRPIWHREGEGT